MRLSDASDQPFLYERWVEIMQHTITIMEADPDPELTGFVTFTLDPDDADTWGIHPVLSVDSGGRIAECDVPAPYYYPTLAQLLTAASVRTAIS